MKLEQPPVPQERELAEQGAHPVTAPERSEATDPTSLPALVSAHENGSAADDQGLDRANERRIELIRKRHAVGLSATEAAELDILTGRIRSQLGAMSVPRSAALQDALGFARRHGFRPDDE